MSADLVRTSTAPAGASFGSAQVMLSMRNRPVARFGTSTLRAFRFGGAMSRLRDRALTAPPADGPVAAGAGAGSAATSTTAGGGSWNFDGARVGSFRGDATAAIVAPARITAAPAATPMTPRRSTRVSPVRPDRG